MHWSTRSKCCWNAARAQTLAVCTFPTSSFFHVAVYLLKHVNVNRRVQVKGCQRNTVGQADSDITVIYLLYQIEWVGGGGAGGRAGGGGYSCMGKKRLLTHKFCRAAHACATDFIWTFPHAFADHACFWTACRSVSAWTAIATPLTSFAGFQNS